MAWCLAVAAKHSVTFSCVICMGNGASDQADVSCQPCDLQLYFKMVAVLFSTFRYAVFTAVRARGDFRKPDADYSRTLCITVFLLP